MEEQKICANFVKTISIKFQNNNKKSDAITNLA